MTNFTEIATPRYPAKRKEFPVSKEKKRIPEIQKDTRNLLQISLKLLLPRYPAKREIFSISGILQNKFKWKTWSD